MGKFRRIGIRWNDETKQQLADLGIDSSEDYKIKHIWLDITSIVAVEIYDGVICFYINGMDTNDCLITDIPAASDDSLSVWLDILSKV